jgi:hypothetical protein
MKIRYKGREAILDEYDIGVVDGTEVHARWRGDDTAELWYTDGASEIRFFGYADFVEEIEAPPYRFWPVGRKGQK